MPRITLAAVRALPKNSLLRDSELKGFLALRRESDVVSFIVEKRINGVKRRITIGKWKSPWTPETARGEAEEIILKSRRGIDAGAEKKEARLRGKTLNEVLDLYLEQHVSTLKPATRSSYERIVRKRLQPPLGDKEIDAVKGEDVKKLHKDLKATPRLANLAVHVLAGAFTWARDNNYCDKTQKPTARVELYEENERERYLEPDEAGRLAKVLREASANGSVNPFTIAQIWSIIFLGARKGEIRTLRWEYLDEQRKGIYLPDSKTGKRRIPLNSLALDIFARVPRLDGNRYIFPNGAGNPQEIAHKVWKRLREKAGLPDVRLHDLRHSFGAVAMDVDGSLPALGKVIGHKKGRSTKRYGHVRPSRADELSEQTARRIAEHMRAEPQRKPGQSWLRIRPLKRTPTNGAV